MNGVRETGKEQQRNQETYNNRFEQIALEAIKFFEADYSQDESKNGKQKADGCDCTRAGKDAQGLAKT